MKIFNWRIYSNKKIKRITHLLTGNSDDARVAKELLDPSKTADPYPRFRVVVGCTQLELDWDIGKGWDRLDYDTYYTETEKIRIIASYKEKLYMYREKYQDIERKKTFKKYEIKL